MSDVTTRSLSWPSVVAMVGVTLTAAAAGALTLAPLRTPPDYRSPSGLVAQPVDGQAPTTGATSGAAAGAVGSPSASVVPSSAAPSAAASPSPSPSASAPVALAGTTMLVLGDAWAVGTGSFACQAAVASQMTCQARGVAGTGYLKAATRAVPKVAGVSVVVLMGGSVDATRPGAAVATAGRTTVAAVRQAYPSARLLVLSPFVTSGGRGATVGALDVALRAAATDASATFVDTGDWFTGPLKGARPGKGTTPTAAAVTGALAARLKPLLRP